MDQTCPQLQADTIYHDASYCWGAQLSTVVNMHGNLGDLFSVISPKFCSSVMPTSALTHADWQKHTGVLQGRDNL